LKHNQISWNQQVENQNHWTLPVSQEVVSEARQGRWNILLTPTKPVPAHWLASLSGKDVLCLASGGGQQGPILAAAGANIVVFDLSDLSMFPDSSFDLIVHPVSNMYVPSLEPVWREAHRVLKNGGVLLSGFTNPLVYLFDPEARERANSMFNFAIPYSDLTSLPPELFKQYMDEGDPIVFGHSLEDQLQGQMEAGFVIAGMYEDTYGGRRLLDRYISSFIATRSVKLSI
jgi:SAM-dependent methyltransferase